MNIGRAGMAIPIALACIVLVSACDLIKGSKRSNPGTTSALRPRVAMLSGDIAAITLESHLTGGNSPSARLLVTWSYSLTDDTLGSTTTTDAFDPYFSPMRTPIAMSDGRDGYALNIVAGDRETDANGAFFNSRVPLGCVHRLTGAAACMELQSAAGTVAAATHTQGGQSLVLFGRAPQLMQRVYDPVTGWGDIFNGPALPLDTLDLDDRSLVSGADGSLFLAAYHGNTGGVPGFEAQAVRFDPLTTSWETVATIGVASTLPKIVLHPEAPVRPFAVWQNDFGVDFSTWQSGSGWAAAQAVPGSSSSARQPAAAMMANGDLLVIWVDGPSDGSRNVRAAWRIGGAWQPAQTLGPAFHIPGRLALGVDRFGNAVAVWPDIGALMCATYVVGDGWQPAESIGFLADLNGSEDFDVAMEPGGRAVAAWSAPAPGGQAGSVLKVAPVGPSVLSMTAQRHTFGGEAIPVTVHLATPPAVAGTLTVTSTLPTSAATVPASVAVAANQRDVTFNVPSLAVTGFVDGRIDVRYGNSSASQPVTVMPEPTNLTFTVTPASVRGGETATLQLQVTPAYPTGLAIDLSSDLTIAPVLPYVTTIAPASTASQPVLTQLTFSAQTARFTARLRGLTRTATLAIQPTAGGSAELLMSVLGPGTITSTPAGVLCGNGSLPCIASFPSGSTVTLAPSAATGHRFFAWEGDADCSEGILVMLAERRCTALFLPRLVPYSQGVSWSFLGTQIDDDNQINPTPAMALDGSAPVIAYVYSDGVIPARLAVRRLDGNAFALLGGPINFDLTKAASEPAIVTTPSGLPYVAWIEGSGTQQNLLVARLQGYGASTSWLAIGQPGVPLNYVAGSRAASPSISLDAELRPMVAWIENGAVKLKRFDGTSWVAVSGGQGPVSAGADRVRMASRSPATGVTELAIAWTQGSGMTRALKVVRDFALTPLGSQVNPAGVAALTEFTVQAESGGAFVSWGDGEKPYTLRSQRWDGSAWVNSMGSTPAGSSTANRLVTLAAPAPSTYMLAWAEASDTPSIGDAIYFTWRQPAGGWNPPLGFPFPGGGVVAPILLQTPGSDSPIVLVVRHNSDGTYRWDVLRYFF